MASLSSASISSLRLSAQGITDHSFTSAVDVVEWLGAMQAQDFAMAKWAIGIRAGELTEKMVEAAMNQGQILRTHVLRPTWHLVSARDIDWMLDLSAPVIKQGLKSRYRKLEITDQVMATTKRIIYEGLVEKPNLSREDLVNKLHEHNIQTDDNRAAHLLYLAELDKLICSGVLYNGRHTYALYDQRVPKTQSIGREEAVSRLTQIYFKSRGPATLADFAWWSGLYAKDVQIAAGFLASKFQFEEIDGVKYWFDEYTLKTKSISTDLHLLPAFDEFIISYTDRSAALEAKNFSKAISDNGIFWPTIIAGGQVVGTWKRQVKKEKVLIETEFFEGMTRIDESELKTQKENLACFLESKLT